MCLSKTVPLRPSCFSLCAPFTTPQHSITSGYIRVVLERQGLLNVGEVKVCPWSKLAERNRPKWLGRPPKPMPFGIVSELKFTAHCQYKVDTNINYLNKHTKGRYINKSWICKSITLSKRKSKNVKLTSLTKVSQIIKIASHISLSWIRYYRVISLPLRPL